MNSDDCLFSKDGPSAETSAQEARYLQALSGPGIVPVQDAGAGRLVLERAACSLADVLHERGPLPESEIRAVGAATASALARVHGAGLVHGDVKPANLLLSQDGELWVTDFDGARPADGKPLERHSPGRLPPGSPARATLDITALALTLAELATGSLLDPGTAWRTADLRRLGCSAGLSAELSFMLGDEASVPSARGVADMFERAGIGPLPEPAVNARRVDPTPTVEFMPARPRPRPGSAEPESTAAEPSLRWWQRLAASWRPR